MCATLLCLLIPGARAQPGGRGEPGAPATQAVEDMLPLSQFEDDPIGIDATPLPPAPAAKARTPQRLEDGFGPMPPPFRAREGEVLTGVPPLKETAHAVEVGLAAGLARVRVQMHFESSAAGPAELRYRLAVPAGSTPGRLRVCNASGCRDGLLAAEQAGRDAYDAAVLSRPMGEPPGTGMPVARLAQLQDARGSALLLHAAPVSRAEPLDVTLEYVTPTRFHGGVTRLRLPRRGMDPRIAPAELTLKAQALLDARVDGFAAGAVPMTLDPRLPAELSARSERGALALQAHHYRCAARQCARVWVAAGSAQAQPRDLFVALDLSPSMQGPARNRLPVALAELLLAAPEGTRVRALGFASRAEPLLDTATDAAEVPLAPLLSGIGDEAHGAATRLEAAMPLVDAWLRRAAGRGQRPLLVVIGDGGLTTGPAAPFAHAQRRGLEVSVVNLADRATGAPLATGARSTGGTVVEAGAAAQDALRGQGEARLREQLAALFAPEAARRVQLDGAHAGRIRLPALRAGEAVVWEGPLKPGTRLQVRADGRRARAREADLQLERALRWQANDALLAVDPRDLGRDDSDWPARPAPPQGRRDRKPPACDPRGPERRYSGLGSDAVPVAAAEARACAAPPAAGETAAGVGKGMPAEPLLGMLRDRIVPVARGCFRRDRAGRGDYAVRAVFHFRLSEREVVEARVEGALQPGLRECLLGAIDKLDVPLFDGLVTVRYPIFTEREPAPARIELSTGAARALDAVLDAAEPASSSRRRGSTIP